MFAIFEIEVGTGRLGISPIPGVGGAYADDLRAITEWGAAACLTMTEMRELETYGATSLAHDLAAVGCAWHHLPIRDWGAPSPATEALWPAAAAEAHAALEAGRRVLTHCRGGCGRSGMAALRLLVERGEDPETALARLRAARPCAVETNAQFDWAAKGVENPKNMR